MPTLVLAVPARPCPAFRGYGSHHRNHVAAIVPVVACELARVPTP